MYNTQHLNVWRAVLFATFFPAVLYLIINRPELLWVSLISYCVIQLIGFNAYLHRYVSHRSYETYKPIEWLMGLLSVPCTIGSPHSWAWIHRAHHRYTETPKDPHCHRHMGFWKALWCLHYIDPEGKRVAMKDVLRTPSFMFIHNHYFRLHLVWIIGIGAVFGWEVLLAAYVIPAVLSTFLVSYILGIFAHQWGYQNFDTGDHSKNSWISHIFTVGDGWHNNHHASPGRYNFQVRWWEIDPTAGFIWVIKKRG